MYYYCSCIIVTHTVHSTPYFKNILTVNTKSSICCTIKAADFPAKMEMICFQQVLASRRVDNIISSQRKKMQVQVCNMVRSEVEYKIVMWRHVSEVGTSWKYIFMATKSCSDLSWYCCRLRVIEKRETASRVQLSSNNGNSTITSAELCKVHAN